jgi:hypothetical protein
MHIALKYRLLYMHIALKYRSLYFKAIFMHIALKYRLLLFSCASLNHELPSSDADTSQQCLNSDSLYLMTFFECLIPRVLISNL